MSEFTDLREKEPMARYKKNIQSPRRVFLKKVAKTIAAVGIATGTIAAVKEVGFKEADSGFKPEKVYQGQVQIKIEEPLNIRTEPIIKNNPNDEPNKLNWNNITEVNGVSIKGHNRFSVENPLITLGDNPNPNSSDKSPWITLQTNEGNVFINFSRATRDFVNPVGEGKMINLSENSTVPENTIGIVMFEQNP